MSKYSAAINCTYNDDGENIRIDFGYKDSNGVEMKTKQEGDDINTITSNIIKDISKAMMKAKAEAEKPKRPEDMTREELLEALKLMEKEANSQKTKNDMLEKRLRSMSARTAFEESGKANLKQVPVSRKKNETYDETIAREYKNFLKLIDSLG